MKACAWIVVAILACCPPALSEQQWVTFHGGYARTGYSRVDFPTCAFDTAWVFDLGEHTWRYQKGTSVWSASPVIARAGDRWMAIIGAYDHNVYGLDATTGKEVWRFTAGGRLDAAPSLARIDGRALVFVGSADRALYALDASDGSEVWSYETMPWSYTVQPAKPTSPVIAEVGGKRTVFAAFFNSDRRPVRNIERAELFALEAATGKLLWKRQVTDHPVSSPAYMHVDGRPLLFIGSEDGGIHVLSAQTGDVVWTRLLTHAVAATPSCALIRGQPVLLAGDRWGMVSCLSARTGETIWTHKTGHETLSTPAIGPGRRGLAVYVGSSDRCIHAIEAQSSREVWRFPTGKYVTASPVACRVVGKQAVICNSLDNCLYVIDGVSGTEIWRFQAGEMLWPYETRGSTTWSSPAVARVDDTAMIFYPAYDGKLYALKSVPRCYTDQPVPDAYAQSAGRSSHRPPVAVLAVGVVLVVLSVAAIIVLPLVGGRRNA